MLEKGQGLSLNYGFRTSFRKSLFQRENKIFLAFFHEMLYTKNIKETTAHKGLTYSKKHRNATRLLGQSIRVVFLCPDIQ